MRVKVKQTCDAAMGDGKIIEFVTAIYKMAEDDLIPCFLSKVPLEGMYIELRVGYTVMSSSARIMQGEKVLAVYNHNKRYFSRP